MPDWSIPKEPPAPKEKTYRFNLARLIANFIVWTLALLTLSVILFYLFFNLKGEELIEKNLSNIFKRPVVMSYLRVLVPFGLTCDEVEVKGLFRAKEVKIQFGLPDFVNQRFSIAYLSLSEPVLSLERTQDFQLVAGDTFSQPTAVAEPDIIDEPKANKKQPTFLLEKVLIQNGRIDFIDHSQERDFKISLQDITLRLHRLAFPMLAFNTDFDLKGTILKSDMPLSGSTIQTEGWINYLARNMNADLKVIEPNGKVSLSTKLNSIANDMTVSGKIKIQNLLAGLKKDDDSKDNKTVNFEEMVFDALQSSGVEIDADFYFKTKMDKFEVNSISFSGNVGYNASQKKEESVLPDPVGVGPGAPAPAPLNMEQ